jgi:hypothetical protein
MRHDDYRIDSKCETCGTPILVPAFWSSRDYHQPKYGMCNHQPRFTIEKKNAKPRR